MKSAFFAAAMLLGSASAGVHKMKLQKIPLSEQLVSAILQRPIRTNRLPVVQILITNCF
jgi:saccharopepsin